MTAESRAIIPLDPNAPEGWWLTAYSALFHPAAGVAVIADVHLGYEWARGQTGDVIPAHSLAETIAKLEKLLAVVCVKRLIVAGDLVESARCPRTRDDVKALRAWLESRDVRIELVAGNHDGEARALSIDVDGWTVGHGHLPFAGRRRILGHLHPIVSVDRVRAGCFVVTPSSVVLPAFTENAAGIDVRALSLPHWLSREPARYVAALEGELFDLGSLLLPEAEIKAAAPSRRRSNRRRLAASITPEPNRGRSPRVP